MDCHVQATGAQCAGYPAAYVSATAGAAFGTGADTLDTPYQPFSAVDAAAGRVYIPVGVHEDTSVGVLCVDVRQNVSCGYTKLADWPRTNRNGSDMGINGGAQIGKRLYVSVPDEDFLVYCFDIATESACPGFPVASDPGLAAAGSSSSVQSSGAGSVLQSFDDDHLYLNIARNDAKHDLACVDLATKAICPGFPITDYAGEPISVPVTNALLAPILDASGAVTGICGQMAPDGTSAPFACFDTDGSPLGGAPWGQLAPGNVSFYAYGGVETIGSRLYLAYTNSFGANLGRATYACWDFATAATCAGFEQTLSPTVSRPYTLRQDPQNPDCIWEVGDAGAFEVFSATFGGATCKEGSGVVDLNPAALYCDGKSGHVHGWTDVTLLGVATGEYDGASITITDANGAVVAGFDHKVVSDSSQTIDISSIPYSGATETLHVSIAINWGTHEVKPADVRLRFDGDPIQMCYSTVVGPQQCAAAQLHSSANAVTTAGGFSDAPGGVDSGDAQFFQAGDPTCQADVAIRKTADESLLTPGTNAGFSLSVVNNGPGDAADVVVSDTLPDGLTFVSGDGCDAAGQDVTCRLASLADGASHDVHLVVHVASTLQETVENTASVDSSTPDPDPANNTSSVSVPVAQERLVVDQTVTTSYTRRYDWTLTKTADRDDVWLYAPHASGPHDGAITWTVSASAQAVNTEYVLRSAVDVRNTGETTATFTLSTSRPVGTPECDGDLTLAPNETVHCKYTGTSKLDGDITVTAATAIRSYRDTDTITWGDPASIVDATPTLTDAKFGFSRQISAADGYRTTFTERLSWTSPCGNRAVSNTAKLTTGTEATDSVTVHTQCESFQTQSAWARDIAGGYYNPLDAGNWATYVKGRTGTYTLYAGQATNVGTATIASDGTVTIRLTSLQFTPGVDNVHIQGYSKPPSGNPSPGKFAFSKTCTTNPCTPGKVALAAYYGIHVSVGKWVVEPGFGPPA
jgi:uncharacterized repeat protein (TIGR01451 family)